MHSRAFLLLRKDLINLERFPLTGIAAHPQNDNLFAWSAKIKGLDGTIWEGGVFQLHITFTEEFNCRPPVVQFMTIPFHPNIDPSDGSLSLPYGNWSDKSTVSTLLLSLQALLSNPEEDEECIRNATAAHLLKKAPLTYKQMALDCVMASLRVDAGLPPYESWEEAQASPCSPTSVPSEREDTTTRLETTRLESTGLETIGLETTRLETTRETKKSQLKYISFDDYHALWKGIATSITGYRKPNSFVDLLKKDKYLSQSHCKHDHTNPQRLMETAPLEERLHQHVVLKYGRPGGGPQQAQTNKSRTRKRIEQLKELYLKGKADENQEGTASSGEDDHEVDQLLQWTQTLDDDQLLTAPACPS